MKLLKAILELPPIAHTRQNHAIEHATIHLLSGRLPGVRLAGRSTPFGFHLYGDVPTEWVERTVPQAIHRLQAGEHALAVHPHCGTNLVTASTLAGVAAMLAIAGKKRRWWDRIPAALAATTVALAAAQPVGYWAQQNVTTDARVPNARVVHIQRRQVGNMTVHYVRIAHGSPG